MNGLSFPKIPSARIRALKDNGPGAPIILTQSTPQRRLGNGQRLRPG
jgi:hypothetical protein